jgi:hypothetical protein
VASTLTLVLGGRIAVGVLAAFGFGEIVSRFSDAPSSIIMQFIGTFGVWMLADRDPSANRADSGPLCTTFADANLRGNGDSHCDVGADWSGDVL